MIRLARHFLVLACILFTGVANASFPASTDPSVCTTAPCYTYTTDTPWPNTAVTRSTGLAACQAAAPLATALDPNYSWSCVGVSAGLSTYHTTRKSDGTFFNSQSRPNVQNTVAPSAPVYSCPANATLSGTTCTCNAGTNQVGTGTGATCVAAQVCDWAKGKSILASGELALPVTNATSCFAGCRFHGDVVPEFLYTPKGSTTVYAKYDVGRMVGTGSACNGSEGMDAGGGPATVDPPPEPPPIPDSGCPPGQVATAQIIVPGGGGGYVCSEPGTTENKRTEEKEEVDENGQEKTTTTTTTTTCTENSCNTTINTSVTSGGTTTTKSETTTQSKSGFCASHPADKNCTGSGDGTGGGPSGDQSTPDHPKLWERKYPDGITGVWTAKKNALLATPLGQLTTTLMPNIPAGGSLPVWNLNLDLGGSWDFGTHDVAPSAQVWEWAGIFIVIGALLLARALIFGG